MNTLVDGCGRGGGIALKYRQPHSSLDIYLYSDSHGRTVELKKGFPSHTI